MLQHSCTIGGVHRVRERTYFRTLRSYELGGHSAIKMNKTIYAKPSIIVQELAEQLRISRFQLIYDLAGMNVFARVNQNIKPEVATAIASITALLWSFTRP